MISGLVCFVHTSETLVLELALNMQSGVLSAIFVALLTVTTFAQAQVRVLAYGDSNTWGWKPVLDGRPVPRYADSQRWPGVMQKALGPGFAVEVNGLIGRTLDADLAEGVGQLEGQDQNGRRRLALALAEAGPVNLLVLVLGTNDLIDDLNRSPSEIAGGLGRLVEIARAGTVAHPGAPLQRILVVVPPPLNDTGRTPFKDLFGPAAIQKSRQLAAEFERAGVALGIPVFDAGRVVRLDGVDGIHLSEQAHRALGQALAREVKRLTSTKPKPVE